MTIPMFTLMMKIRSMIKILMMMIIRLFENDGFDEDGDDDDFDEKAKEIMG